MLALLLPLLVADNLALLLQVALLGLGMYALGLRLGGGSRAAALVGGLVFMAAPTFQAHLHNGHAHFNPLAFAPLFVLALLRLRETSGRARRRWFVAGALCFALTSGAHITVMIYLLLPLTAVIALQQLWHRNWRNLAQLLLVCLAGSLLRLLLILPVVEATLASPVYTAAGGHVRYSLDLLAIITPSPHHPLYGHLDYTHQVLGSRIGERSAWIGLVAGALALLALLRGRGRFWLGLALPAWLLALGPLLLILSDPLTLEVDGYASYVTLPHALLLDLPLMNFARTPGRFNFVLALAIACLATHGAALLFAQPRLRSRLRRALLLTLLLAAILFDYQWFWPFRTWDAGIPQPVAALAQRDDLRAVLNVPVRRNTTGKQALWLQTAHQLPLIGGHVTRNTPVNPARLELLERSLDPALLRLAGADIVIVLRSHAGENLEALAEAQLGPALYRDKALVVYETPPTETPPLLFVPPEPSLRFKDQLEIPLYAPQAGWLELGAEMWPDGRDLLLSLDDVPLQRWVWSPGQTEQRASLPLRAGAWHMLTLTPEPACLRVPAPAMVCRSEVLEQLTMEILPTSRPQARFAGGVTMLAVSVPAVAEAGGELVLRLHWAFAQPRDSLDIRFVHLLDASGRRVAQSDETLGPLPAGAQRSERVVLTLPATLPPGDYHAQLGWYRLPQGTRLPLLEPADARDDVLPLGLLRVS